MQMRRPVMRTAMIVAVLSLMLSAASSAQAWPASHITASLPAGAPEEAKKDIEAASAQVDDVERVSGAWASASDIPAQTAEADHRLMTPSLAEADTLPTGFRINEVVFHPESGAHQWVELTNEGPSIIDVGGYALTDEDGNWYVFPEDTPSVPVGAFVVVLYDGLGAAYNDLGFDDDVMVLHTQPGLVSVFEGEADQVALYTGTKLQPIYLPLVVKNVNTSASVSGGVVTSGAASRTEDVAEPTLISYVAWGADPGTDTGDAAAMGLWSTGAYVPVSVGESQATILPGESIGLLPGSACAYEHSWTLYPMGEVTFGDSNPPPAINSYHPNAGDTLDSETFAVAWNLIHNAVGYRFQLDDGPDFMSPYTDTVLGGPAYVAPSPIPEGTYYWRVKTILQEGESAWSPGVLVRSLEYPGDTVTAQAAQIGVLGIEWQLQRKDTNMLCLYGCPEAGDARWDAPHPESGGVKPHGVNYCSRAALSMFVSYCGAKLSQDRIAHYDYRDTTSHILDTYNTLGHGRPNSLPMSSLISWAGMPYSRVGSPTYEQVKGWIGEQRPMIAWVTRYGRDNRFGYHFVVVDGYREWSDGESTYEQIHILDPWDGDRWPLFDEYSGNINALYVGPDHCPLEIREDGDDEYRVNEDADGDGICDFDEAYRFHTDPNDPDSDGDRVPDKADLREYVFSPTHGRWRLRWADWDGDGLRKEVDPDNDNSDNAGSLDGCEDSNHNGKYEPELGETSNFDSSQEKECGPTEDMILVPAGEFRMGCDESNANERCSDHELPLHTVYVDEYTIDKYEVTNAQYAEFLNVEGNQEEGGAAWLDADGAFVRIHESDGVWQADVGYDNHPVAMVTWYGARAYCEWQGKRLPTEAEWEKAARGGNDTRVFPWGNEELDCSRLNYWVSGVCCVGDTMPIGSYPIGASPYGALDMSGNVYEWVNDWYGAEYYGVSAYSNPQGPVSGTHKVVRGGGWYHGYWYYRRVAHRGGGLPYGSPEFTGFRCAGAAPTQ